MGLFDDRSANLKKSPKNKVFNTKYNYLPHKKNIDSKSPLIKGARGLYFFKQQPIISNKFLKSKRKNTK